MGKDASAWRVVDETLSDGSIVYDVSDGEHTFHCVDEPSAYELLDAIDRYTCSLVVQAATVSEDEGPE